MSKDLFSRYVWIVDTIRRHSSITFAELNRLWIRASVSDGIPLARRTFFRYRESIAELFNVDIMYDRSTYGYYIEQSGSHEQGILDWMLNSVSIGSMLNDAADVGQYIFLEEVPSAREYLNLVIDALRSHKTMLLSYHPYTRTHPTPEILFEPYFLKIFRQRWYVTGRVVKEDRIKTYALDRIVEAVLESQTYSIPDDFDAEEYFRHSFGIIFDEGAVKKVVLRAGERQAKYLRSVPLHHSQRETIHEKFSVFTYEIKITPDFIQEILSHGPDLIVQEPPELRAMIANLLRDTLKSYS